MEGKTPREFDEEEFLHRICATAERTALGHLVPVFRCATTALVAPTQAKRQHERQQGLLSQGLMFSQSQGLMVPWQDLNMTAYTASPSPPTGQVPQWRPVVEHSVAMGKS